MTTPTDGVELNWVQARDVLACVEQLVERHARLMADAPALSGAADRCAEDAVGAIEDLAEPLARWADALDDWQAAAQRQIDDRQALAEALIARLAAADAQTPAAVRAAVHAVMGLRAPEDSEGANDDGADADAEAATSEPPAAPLALADTADVSDASGDLALAGSPDAAEPAAPAAPAEPAEPESVEQIPPSAAAQRAPAVDVAVAAPAPLPPLPPRRPAPEPSDSAEMSAAFDFPLHDLDPLAEADEEPSPFDFDDGPANDDLSTLQSKDLDDVIDATPALEVEDITMGSLGLMETSALSTDQVRAQLKVIRAERAAAAVAARTDPPAPAAPVEASVEIAIEVDAPAPGPDAADQRAQSPAPEAAPVAPSAPSTSFPPLPRRSTDSLIEASVVEVESGPIDVLDVRQLLGEPPSRPSRIDAAVRAALSSPPEAARAPRSRPPTTDQSDWLEATPTSYPPASALQGAPAQSIEGDPDSVERAPIDGEMDKTVALQSVDLSAAMEAVDAEDWLDASQSAELLTSNQSLEALARDAEPEADDPWAALDISTHGELKAGHVTQPRPTRAALNVSIGVEYCGRFFTARSVNISSAGMLVTCEQDIDDGERVDLFFEMPRGESIAVQATVCRSKAAAERRVALAFVNLRYDDRVVIDRYVTSKTA